MQAIKLIQHWKGKDWQLRVATPEDCNFISEAYDNLSIESRYQRFHTRNAVLSPHLLSRLLHSQHGEHETWLLESVEDVSSGVLAGASFWRHIELRKRAELSFIVTDSYQNQGLGTLLLALIWIRCQTHGIQELHGHVMSDNYRVVDWFRQLGMRMQYVHPSMHCFEWELSLERLPVQYRAAKYLNAALHELALQIDLFK